MKIEKKHKRVFTIFKASVVHMPLHVEALATPYMCPKLGNMPIITIDIKHKGLYEYP